jgi:hypothetical protein
MFSITLRRSVATLAIVAGLLAAAVPASAQGGGAVVTMGGQKDRGDFTRLQGQARGSRSGGEVISSDAY